jgi:hypothetical protein
MRTVVMSLRISPEFASAIVQAQTNIEGAKKGKSNPAFKSKYADLAAVWDAVGKALEEAGLAVLQFPTEAPPGFVGLDTLLVFKGTGEILGQTFHAPVKDATNPQAMGSALTYARRYALSAVLGVCPEDDDGNKASEAPKAQQPKEQPKPTGWTAGEAGKAWSQSTDLATKKETYRLTKASGNIPEPHKTELLKTMSDTIKAETAAAKEKNNG